MALITELVESPYLMQGVLVAIVLLFLSGFSRDLAHGLPYKNIPIVGRSRWELSNKKAKNHFMTSARELIAQGFEQGRTVFQVMFSFAPMIILHPKYLNEVKSHPDLSFRQANQKAFFAGYPGFDAFSGTDEDRVVIIDMINKKLTQSLGPLAIPLSREVADALKDSFGQPKDWESRNFAEEIPYMVARVSSFIFLGEKICRDKEWIDVSVNYVIDAFIAARDLRLWPSFLHPLVHWFLPRAKSIRKHIRVARRIIDDELNERARLGEKATAERRPDALDWMRQIAAGQPLDMARAQIGLSLAAIHTTSNLVTNVLYDLAAYPEYIQPLRDEIKTVMEEDGVLKKSSLTKMKLMDSILKESQRMNPVAMTSLHRHAVKDIPLSDGMKIPKGASMVISAHVMNDETIYSDPKVYDGYRFYRMRQEPGHENKHQLVMASPSHFGFGYGVHTCPGRFFASNEIKIILVHMLMKYDFKFAEEGSGRPKSFELGTEIVCDHRVKMLFKTREPGISLASLGETLDE